ncbi:MAG: HEAT repeat domain-containing protein [Gemmataceae bacterium]|nr:HEAT repeat domain-containing protein [Gemmataceae bacterium]
MSLKRVALLGVLIAAIVALVRTTSLDAADPVANPDEESLSSAKIATDGAGLVAYLRSHVLSDADRQKIEALILQLGAEKFPAREEAQEKLIAIGSPAVSFLREASRSSNREMSHRAGVCLSEIATQPDSTLTAAAIRVLARRDHADALAAVLEFFPFAGEEAVEEDALNTLATLGIKNGKPEAKLVEALKDPLPARRGAAACVLARQGDRETRNTVRQMLGDADAKVRFFVGKGLLGERFPRPDTPLSMEDKKYLKAANVSNDSNGLIAFFKKRTLSPEDRKNLEKLVEQLDSNQFGLRQEASQKLVEMGTPALPFLRAAKVGSSLELTRRVEDCIKQIERGPGPALPQAAARMLVQRRPAAALQVLLDYVPFADDSAVEEEVIAAIGVLCLLEPKVPQDLLKMLKDDVPARRSVAALVLGQVGEKDHIEQVRELVKDKDAGVRLRAAQALLTVKDKEGIPVLLALMDDGPLPQASLAEGFLQQLGGEKAPTLSISEGTPDARKKASEAWAAWWRDNGDKIDLTRPPTGRPYLGLTMIVTLVNTNNSRVWEIGNDGKTRWEIKDAKGAIDAQVLPNNHVLIAEYYGRRVTERDRTGKVVWEQQSNQPIAVQRMPNGNTVIATNNDIQEVTRDGKVVFTHKGGNGQIAGMQKQPNGNLVFVTYGAELFEVDSQGKAVRNFKLNAAPSGLFSVEVLPGGRYLVPLGGVNKVAEFDSTGKIVHEVPVTSPNTATKLPNGNLVVSSMNNNRVVEVDKTGKVLWEHKTDQRVFKIRRR